MKIGILTYHRSNNYGAILQAIATRIVLQDMGHEVYYVDYWPSYHRDMYCFFSFKRLMKRKLHYLINRIYLSREILNRIAHFDADIEKYIAPYCRPLTETYDVIVYGSDQIWRRQTALKDFNPVYFAQNDFKTSKHISYAPSMGILQTAEADKAFLKNSLSKFAAISVREKDLQNYLSELGFTVQLVLDPTLLLTANQWDSIIHPQQRISRGYVLYYSLQKEAFSRNAIEQFANKKGLRVVEVKGVADKDKENCISQCGPADFVSLIKYADYVFTSSFHGLAFSIIYHKPFYAAYKKNRGRAQSLLSSLGLEARLLAAGIDTINEVTTIDYAETDLLLSTLKNESMKYLYANIL